MKKNADATLRNKYGTLLGESEKGSPSCKFAITKQPAAPTKKAILKSNAFTTK